MSSSGAVTLGGIADRINMLEVACSKCERRGRLSVARLIERHDADAQLTNLRTVLAGDCPRRDLRAMRRASGQPSAEYPLHSVGEFTRPHRLHP